MPQLDPSSYPSQVFWLVLCFFTMLFLMAKIVLPKIAHAIEARQKIMSDNISEAEEFKKEADKIFQEYNDVLSKAKDEAAAIISKARDEIAEYTEKKEAEVNLKIAKDIDESELKIEKMKKEALSDVKNIVLDTALETCNKIVGINIEKDKAQKIIQNITGA